MGNCCANKVASSPTRVVYPSTTVHLDEATGQPINPNAKFAVNRISTTKYSIWTFLPLNLWEQFHRFANVYFVFILVLNFMPGIDAFAKEVAPIPVLLTLAVVAVKDAFEDFRRHLSDRRVNRRICKVFSIEKNCYVDEQWQNIRPGDFVRLCTNEMIPADVLLLHSSNIAGICHIETANLDGESNLKQRELLERRLCKEPFSPLSFVFPAEVEAPSAELYKFSGKIIRPDGFIPIRKNNMILRGCVLRNTDYVEGMVIYAGKETKAAMNNTGARFKRSKLERCINRDVIWCILILAIICFTGAIGSGVWQQNLPGEDVLFVALDRNASTSTPAFQGFLNFWRFIIIFQSIIPLPLYVSIEFIKMHQVWHMNNDLELYDANRDRRVEVRAFNILEDLGQVEYVFCDKTGTLTENKMEFKRASIHGVDYWTEPGLSNLECSNGPYQNHVTDPSVSCSPNSVPLMNSLKTVIDRMSLLSCSSTSCPESHPDTSGSQQTPASTSDMDAYVEDFILALTICNTAVVSATKNSASIFQMPTKRRGLRGIFRPSPSGSASARHRTGISLAAASKLRRKFVFKDDDDEGQSSPVKHSRSVSSIFSRGFRRLHRKTDLASVPRSDLTEESESPGTSDAPGARGVKTSPAGQPEQVSAGSSSTSTTTTTTQTNEAPAVSPAVNIVDTESATSIAATPLTGVSKVPSTQSLPPVVKGLQLDLPTPRALHRKGQSVDKKPQATPVSKLRWHIPDSDADKSDEEDDEVDERPDGIQVIESDLSSCMSLSIPEAGPFSTPTTVDGETPASTDLQNELRAVSTRTLTVVAHDGASYELPVSDDFVPESVDAGACPLSDQTLYGSYESESPDELSLVKAACQQGCKLLQRGVDFILLWLPTDGLVALRVLHILPFDSVRKRMSILVRHPATNDAVLYTKGADTAVLDRVKCNNARDVELLERTRQHIDEYSRSGLRTLVIAKRIIPEEELKTWSREYTVAETTAGDSTEVLGALMDRIEKDFTLLGATGIEDRLQEGVPQTIEHLREAGMHVWVLTGDKQETAVNVAHSARLITDEHKLIFINANSKTRTSYLLTCHLHAVLCGQTWSPREAISDVMSDGPDLTDSSSSESNDGDQVVAVNGHTDDMITFVNTRRVRLCAPTESSSQERDLRRSRHRIHRSASESRVQTGSPNHFSNGGTHAPRVRRSRYRRRHRTRSKHRRGSHHMRPIRSLHRRKSSFQSDTPQLALIIDGETLKYALDDENKSNFLRLSEFCSSVLCCRSTPSQKASVVSLVKEGLNVLTLAIGDGANDVNMIQVANVGVGISGQEGMQAVMASDFAISRFRFLERLVILHGHMCYDKLAHTALYLFYKDAIYIFLLFWFQLFNGFSGSNAIDQLSQILFSITFTSLPSLLMGIWDNPIDAETLLANPILYRSGIQGKSYRPWLFWINILDAVWQALIIFFIPYLFYADSAMTLWRFGVLQTNIMVICSLLHAALETRTWVIFHWISLIVSYLVLWVFFTMIYHALAVVAIPPECPYRVIFVAMHDGPFWLLTLVTTAVALLPRLLFIALKNTLNPSWDTIAGLLAKRYGRGKRLPLEPYIFGTGVLSPVDTTEQRTSLTPSTTGSVQSTTPRGKVTIATSPRVSIDVQDGAFVASPSGPSEQTLDTTAAVEHSAQFMSRVGQLFTVSGHLLRGVAPPRVGTRDDNVSCSAALISPLSMVNLRSLQHTAVDLRRRQRRRTQTFSTHTPRHSRHLSHPSNNFDDDAGLPSNPVIWPAVDPDIREHSLTARRYSASRVRPSVLEARHHVQTSDRPPRQLDSSRAFSADPLSVESPSTCRSDTPVNVWLTDARSRDWFSDPRHPLPPPPASILSDPPPPYTLRDLPDPQQQQQSSSSSDSVQPEDRKKSSSDPLSHSSR